MPSHTPSDRCTYRDIAGRRCRLPRKPAHPDLCAHHARRSPEGTIENPQALVAEILGPGPDFSNAKAVNRTAGKLLEALLAGRIPARQAAIAGYLCQLIIQTLPQLRIEAGPEGGAPMTFQFITHAPRPDYSKNLTTPEAVQAHAEDQANKEAAYRSLLPNDQLSPGRQK
jgi:hypothetical protein